MARLAARSTAADGAAAWHIATLRARVKLDILLRQALVQLGIDPATVLRIADEAAQELAVTADSVEGSTRARCRLWPTTRATTLLPPRSRAYRRIGAALS
jgi:hypothetical protein